MRSFLVHGTIRAAGFSTDAPPVAEYQAWLDAQREAKPRGFNHMKLTAAAIRRMVIARKSGVTWQEISLAHGLSKNAAYTFCRTMPERLRWGT